MTAAFRRHLALSFLIYPTPVTTSLSDSDISSIIHLHLNESKDFKITRGTNYRTLAASLTLLDVGIGPGPTNVPCRPPPTEGESPGNLLNAQEIAFNKKVDTLVQHIKLLGNKIVEAGAISDLTRLEAKNCLERLVHRLENSVRIGGALKRSVFDDPEVDRQRKKLFKWVTKKPATPVGGSDDAAAEADVDDEMED
jgi:hypothetical protein